MENLIQKSIKDYYIFRVPQLFGKLIHHKTLINYIYEKIVTKEKFVIYSNAYRYVIFIDDLYKIVDSYVKYGESKVIFDIANPYKYSIFEVVKIIEKLTNKKAIYDIEEKEDTYDLDLSLMLEFLKRTNININFGNEYLFEKLSQIMCRETKKQIV